MKKSLITVFLLALNINLANAGVIESVDTPIQWFVLDFHAVSTSIHGQEAINVMLMMTDLIAKETNDTLYASSRQVCKAYLDATNKTDIEPVGCDVLMREIIQYHNVLADKGEKLDFVEDTFKQIQWYPSVLYAACYRVEQDHGMDAFSCDRLYELDLNTKKYSLSELENICVKSMFAGDKSLCDEFLDKATDAQNNNAYKLKQMEKVQDSRYEKLVEKNEYCESVYDYAGDNVMQSNMDKLCKRFARQYAQSHACKLHSYVRDGNLWQDDVYGNQYIGNLFCGLNVSRNYIDNYHIKHETVNGYSPEMEQYEYTPSYQDCVATFDEQKCDGIANGNYID